MSLAVQLKGARERRAAVTAELRRLGDVLRKEQRAMTSEERVAFDRMKAEFTLAGEAVRSTESALAELASLVADGEGVGEGGEAAGRGVRPGSDYRDYRPAGRGDHRAGVDDFSLALRGWGRQHAGAALTAAEARACRAVGIRPDAREIDVRLGAGGIQKRALSVGAPSAGGYTVPEGFGPTLDRALLAYANVRRVAQVLRTDTGNAVPWPTATDTSNTGERLAEAGSIGSSVDPTFGVVSFGAYKYSSKPVLVSSELLQDSAFNLEQVLGEMLAERIGRIQGTEFTTGTGSSQPQGLVTGATAGLTAASATAIAGTEIVRLAHKLDPAYRMGNGTIGYMCHDGILAALAILVDSNGQPLFQTSFREGAPDRLYGYPVFNNNAMQATIATGTVTVLFGDYQGFGVRDVNTVRFVRLNERYIDNDQVGFIAFMRSDARYLNSAKVYKLTQA